MRRTRAAATIGLFFGLAAAAAAAAPDKDGWVNLIEGTALDGWVQRGGRAKYRAEEGEIVGTSVPNTSNSFLCTAKDYGDFELQLEFKVAPTLNSGVQVRSQFVEEGMTVESAGKKISGGKPGSGGKVFGYQVEIDPSARAFSGGIYDEGRRGWLKDLSKNEPARKAFKPNDWNAYRIVCRGDAIETWINGVPAATLQDAETPKGFIGLQVHGVGKKEEPLEVRWKNVRLKEIK